MSLHKLIAGSGYDYLTRQVAALDATDKGHIGLASYYTERGESPGVWVGSGMAGIDGLDVGDPVTAEQMRALFGCGLHPLAELRLRQWEGADLIGQDFGDVMRLGALFKIIDVVDALAHTPCFARDMLHGLGQCNLLLISTVCGQVTLGPRPIRSTATPRSAKAH